MLILKPLWGSTFTFESSTTTSEMGQFFAKKIGFLPEQENLIAHF